MTIELDPGRYEVRVVDEERVALLIFTQSNGNMAVVKLNDEQAHHLSVLLVQAAERISST